MKVSRKLDKKPKKKVIKKDVVTTRQGKVLMIKNSLVK
jgi:hypothetical protein